MVEFQPQPLRMFSSGPCLNFVCFDGHHFGCLLRDMTSRNMLLYDAPEAYGGTADTAMMDKLTDFNLGTRCMSQILSLATRWGLAPWCTPDIFDNIHTGMKSICNDGQNL